MGQSLAAGLGNTAGNLQKLCQNTEFGISANVWKDLRAPRLRGRNMQVVPAWMAAPLQWAVGTFVFLLSTVRHGFQQGLTSLAAVRGHDC